MLKNVSVRGKGQVVTAEVDDREVRIGNFPISIDFDEFAVTAESPEVDQRVAETKGNLGSYSNRRTLLLGVDRLDYTKGIPERLAAFGNALERFPRLREKISLVQIVVPSRVNIPKYRDLKLEIERMVSENQRQVRPDRMGSHPLHLSQRRPDRADSPVPGRRYCPDHSPEGRYEPRGQGILRRQCFRKRGADHERICRRRRTAARRSASR